MKQPYTPQDLTGILRGLLQQERYQTNTCIRPLACKSSEMIGVRLHEVDDALTIFAYALRPVCG